MARFKPYDYRQTELIPVSFECQILPGTFEYTLSYLIEHELDTTCFHKHFRNDTTGRLAYDPALLLKVILLAYSRGITSSRKMAQLCRENILFMALSAHTQPHFTTLSDFISRSSEQIQEIFLQVLMVCDAQGLIGKEMFAIDGCKLPSNASKEWSGTHTDLKHKQEKIEAALNVMLSAQRKQDVQALEEDFQEREHKQIEKLQQTHAKIKAFLQSTEERLGRKGTPIQSNITDNESAKMKSSHGMIQGYNGVATVDSRHQVIVHAEVSSQVQERGLMPPMIEASCRNLKLSETEQQQIKYLADAGFHTAETLIYLNEHNLQGYLADQDLRNRDPRYKDYKARHKPLRDRKNEKFTLADFQIDVEAQTCVCPAGKSLWVKNQSRIQHGYRIMQFKGYVKDCRPCPLRDSCLLRKTQTGARSVSVPLEMLDAKRGSLHESMKAKMDTLQGRAIYSQRLGIVEPVFGNITATIGFKRFSYRGFKKVNAQWQLITLLHNLQKVHRYGRDFRKKTE